jgi:hypothetical protein
MQAFVLMPFATEFDDVYEHLIRGVLSEQGFAVSRADESFGSRNIMHDVLQGIVDADLVLADLTGANPNVYYELGLAHALGKNVILLTQDLDEVPFDLRAYRVVTYSTHFARIADAQTQIRLLAEGASSGKVQFGSPVTDFNATSGATPSRAAKQRTLKEQIVDVEDERGPLDVSADLTEGMEGVNRVLTEFGQRLATLNPQIAGTAEAMQGPLRHDPSGMRKVVRTLAAQLSDFSGWLKSANGVYRDDLQKMTVALDALFTIGITNREEALEQLPKALGVVESVEIAGKASLHSMQGMASALEDLPRIEKDFNRAKRLLWEELQSLIANVEQTISVMARTRAAGENFRSTHQGG